MGIWRQAHADAPSSRKLNRLSDSGERLFWRMLGQTDQWGRLTGEPEKIRIVCIPTLPWDDDKLHHAIADLERTGSIDRYSTDDVWVTQIVNFDKRQAFAKQRRQPSRFPDKRHDSLSPSDLAPSLPLLDERLEARAQAPPPAIVEPETCDPGLSNGGLRLPKLRKSPASTGEHRQKREDRRESVLPTAEVRTPTRESLPIAHAIKDSLEAAGAVMISDYDTPKPLATAIVAMSEMRGALTSPADEMSSFVRKLSGADDGTANVLAKLRKQGLPPAAFLTALESLEERRGKEPPLQSEVRYVVGTLKAMLREGTYRQDGAPA